MRATDLGLLSAREISRVPYGMGIWKQRDFAFDQVFASFERPGRDQDLLKIGFLALFE